MNYGLFDRIINGITIYATGTTFYAATTCGGVYRRDVVG
jgi:hypothetical protein